MPSEAFRRHLSISGFPCPTRRVSADRVRNVGCRTIPNVRRILWQQALSATRFLYFSGSRNRLHAGTIRYCADVKKCRLKPSDGICLFQGFLVQQGAYQQTVSETSAVGQFQMSAVFCGNRLYRQPDFFISLAVETAYTQEQYDIVLM